MDNARLDLRLPRSDRDAFEEAARRAGDRNVSSWALRMLRGLAISSVPAAEATKKPRKR